MWEIISNTLGIQCQSLYLDLCINKPLARPFSITCHESTVKVVMVPVRDIHLGIPLIFVINQKAHDHNTPGLSLVEILGHFRDHLLVGGWIDKALVSRQTNDEPRGGYDLNEYFQINNIRGDGIPVLLARAENSDTTYRYDIHRQREIMATESVKEGTHVVPHVTYTASWNVIRRCFESFPLQASGPLVSVRVCVI